MSQRTITTDDLTGVELSDGDGKKITVSMGSDKFSLDLTDASQAALKTLLTEGYGAFTRTMAAAGFAASEPVKPARKRSASAGTSDTADIRAWVRDTTEGKDAAREAGYDAAGIAELTKPDARGRLKSKLAAAYAAKRTGGKPITPAASIPDAPSKSGSKTE